jgi:hypothetical protein
MDHSQSPRSFRPQASFARQAFCRSGTAERRLDASVDSPALPQEGPLQNALRLLLPALIPSWKFFDVIAPSPRIEYALASASTEAPSDWREFRPRPEQVSVATMLKRLVWNPRWNETLFLVSCAERLVDEPTAHSEDEIFQRIAADLARQPDAATLEPWLSFRLVFVSREGEAIEREVLFQPQPRRLASLPVQ